MRFSIWAFIAGLFLLTEGQKQRARTRKARLRRPDLRRYYRNELSDITPGAFEFNVQVIGQSGVATSIDSAVESFRWTDDGTALTGDLSLRRPDPTDASSLPIRKGYQVRLRVRWKSRWYVVWTMRADSPETDLGEGTVTVEVADDLDRLRRNKRNWYFRKTKSRKRGWRADEIARKAGRREGVRIGKLARGTTRFELTRKDASALDIVKAAYAKEREATGRRFIIRLRNGRLDVVPYRRNPILYVLKDQISAALLSEEQKSRPVTVVRARGRLGKGRGSKKLRMTVFRKSLVNQFGYLSRDKDYGRVSSRAALRRAATRELAKEVRIRNTASITFPGIPFIARGDGMRWIVDEPGWKGRAEHSLDRSFVYVRSIAHEVTDTYTSTAEIAQEDPYAKDAARLDAERRQRAKKRRKARR